MCALVAYLREVLKLPRKVTVLEGFYQLVLAEETCRSQPSTITTPLRSKLRDSVPSIRNSLERGDWIEASQLIDAWGDTAYPATRNARMYAKIRRCFGCGAALITSGDYCPNCGSLLDTRHPPTTRPNGARIFPDQEPV